MRRPILGVVLAGGASRRFGSDKALALLDGRPLIAHAIAALAPHVGAVAIAGARFGDLASIADWPGPGLGPLGGLAGALRHAAGHGFEAVLTVPCDTPRIPDDALRRLLDGEWPALLRELPVCGVWPVALAEPLLAHLGAGGDLSMRRWADVAGACWIDAGSPIMNINTPAELDMLARAGARRA